ncbi:MAG: hypothetical protein Q4F30_10815, partial [Akkermansia sp.]|nr:hypothetical protein [Akkermansia sp.]
TITVFSGTVGEEYTATCQSDDTARTLQLTGKSTDTASIVYSSSAGFDKNVNIVKEGAGKQVFSGDSSTFDADINVKEGVLEFLNNSSLHIEDLALAAGGSAADKTLKIRTDANEAIAANRSNVGMADVHGTMTAKAGSALDSNLTLNAGAVLDVSGAVTQQYSEIGGNKYDYAGGLNMLDNSLTLHSGAYLSSTDLNRLLAMTWGEKYELAYNVGSFTLGSSTYDMSKENPLYFTQDEHNTAVEASKYFANLQEEDYYICYTGSGVGVNGSNVGVVYIYKAPEPTTGTLSLLALAALCARRRRQK